MILGGRFELVELLGSGGVAEVWRARDTTAGAPVAIKRLLPQLASDRQVRRRFLREADVASRLDHPSIGRLLGTGEDGGLPFLAMELVDGEDLGRRLEHRGRLSPAESFAIAHAVASALAHAHARGVVHRDVKPQNILLAGADVKLANRNGLTPLALAASNGSAAMLKLLVDAGADVNAPDPAGETPLMLAAPAAAIDLPLKLLVSEDESGRTWIAYNSPAYLRWRHGLPDALLSNIDVVPQLMTAALNS